MKFIEISGKIALIALAAVCLLAIPALSMPVDNCPCQQEQGEMFAPMNNLTAEELGNMTLGELKEMQHQAWNNTAACRAKEPERDCSQWRKSANEYLGMKGKGMARESPIMLLIGDLTVEDLGNMTFNQIRDLSEKKMAELNNMTLTEVKQLHDKKVAERDNMTLNQLKEKNKNMRQIAEILEGLGSGRHIKA